MTKNQRDAAKAVEALRGEMIDLADALHAHPEMALEEHESSRRCAETLQAHGFDVTRPFRQMPTAFLATRGRGKPVIGMLAEYDALPNCGLDGGPGHGCGHNLLGPAAIAGAIAAADVLAKRKARGTIALFGCPAEETLVGKCYMARDGAFDGLDACLSWHPSDMTCADHESWAANDSMTFEFFGVSAHAAGSPHEGRSALDAVEIMNVAVNFLREHVEDSTVPLAHKHLGDTRAIQRPGVTWLPAARRIKGSLIQYDRGGARPRERFPHDGLEFGQIGVVVVQTCSHASPPRRLHARGPQGGTSRGVLKDCSSSRSSCSAGRPDSSTSADDRAAGWAQDCGTRGSRYRPRR